jgi:TonB family protein
MFILAMDRFYFYSFLAHFFILGLGVFLSQKMPHLFQLRPPTEVITEQLAVRVDLVDLPRLTLKEQRLLKKTPFKVVQEKPKDAEVVKEIPKTSPVEDKNALEVEDPNLNKKKVVTEKEVPKDEAKKIDPAEKTTSKSLSQLREVILAGNKIRAGSAFSENQNNADTAVNPFTLYVHEVLGLVKQHWKLPGYLNDKKLNCRIRVYIGMNGTLLKSEIYESSGSSFYDDRALSAVSAATPFPIVPSDISERVRSGEIVLGFPL